MILGDLEKLMEFKKAEIEGQSKRSWMVSKRKKSIVQLLKFISNMMLKKF